MTSARPARCPSCGSGHIAAVLYDFPAADKKLQEDLQNRRALLDRRAPTGNDPRWACLTCRFEWGHPRGLSGSSPGQDDLA